MRTILRMMMVMSLAGTSMVVSRAQTTYVIGGYYPAWRSSLFPASELHMDALTLVIQAFAWPDSNGGIHGYPTVPDPSLVSRVQGGGGKVLVALGGYGNCDGFPRVATNPAVRKAFVDTLKFFVSINGYDGVDIDWEWPQTAAQRESLTALVRDVRAAFDEIDSSMIITMAVAPGAWSGQWLNFNGLRPYVNWFNAMTYDFHGSWTNHAGHNAPLYAPATDQDGSVDQGIQYLTVTRGIPKSQILLGLPFYAKIFQATALYAPSTGEEDVVYHVAADSLAAGWTYVWDNVSQVPYLRNPAQTKVFSFDDSASIAIKCDYVKSKGLAGVAIWALGQDLVGTAQPLMDAVSNTFNAPQAVEGRDGSIVPTTMRLEQNYPNPFNPNTVVSYQLSVASSVRLVVYDIVGREVALLVDEKKAPGIYSVRFDGSGLASGVYLYRLVAGSVTQTRRMVLLK